MSIALILAAALSAAPPLPVAPQLDVARYLGTWYEIVRMPERFERDCAAVTATYALRKDGGLSVENRCRKGGVAGPEQVARGKAWIPDARTPAKLKVQFFWPFRADYWVIELDPEYRFALVGNPNREHLWVLSRTPRMDPLTLSRLLDRARELGFDTRRLERTPQP